MWLILDDDEDHWRNSVIALGASRDSEMNGLPRLEDWHEEGALISWTKWIPERFGLFANLPNLSPWYWSLSYREDKRTQQLKVGDTEMTVRQVELSCHSLEGRVGVGLPTNNKYYTVSKSVPSENGRDSVTQSDAYYRILSMRTT
jgi:hypothetical protein